MLHFAKNLELAQIFNQSLKKCYFKISVCFYFKLAFSVKFARFIFYFGRLIFILLKQFLKFQGLDFL